VFSGIGLLSTVGISINIRSTSPRVDAQLTLRIGRSVSDRILDIRAKGTVSHFLIVRRPFFAVRRCESRYYSSNGTSDGALALPLRRHVFRQNFGSQAPEGSWVFS